MYNSLEIELLIMELKRSLHKPVVSKDNETRMKSLLWHIIQQQTFYRWVPINFQVTDTSRQQEIIDYCLIHHSVELLKVWCLNQEAMGRERKMSINVMGVDEKMFYLLDLLWFLFAFW